MRVSGSENSIPAASGNVFVLPSPLVNSSHNSPYPVQFRVGNTPYVSVNTTPNMESTSQVGKLKKKLIKKLIKWFSLNCVVVVVVVIFTQRTHVKNAETCRGALTVLFSFSKDLKNPFVVSLIDDRIFSVIFFFAVFSYQSRPDYAA